VATVGEEGIGDLRGVRHLYREDGQGRESRGFISLDGVGLDRIIHRGVGSTRLRITLRGPGGHSWTDWGLPNPIHALGRIVTGLEDLHLPHTPRTTATVARWAGGKSINAIPQEAWVEVDLRSEGAGALRELEEALVRECRTVLDGDGSRGREASEGLRMEITELGRRPAGVTPEDAPSHPAGGSGPIPLLLLHGRQRAHVSGHPGHYPGCRRASRRNPHAGRMVFELEGPRGNPQGPVDAPVSRLREGWSFSRVPERRRPAPTSPPPSDPGR
jgi:hypothetical protein